MSNHTLRSLFLAINSRRESRLGFGRTLEQASPLERPRWNMQIAVFDEDYRRQLGAIDELPDLLVRAPRLREGWPYPSEYTLQEVRAELANRTHKSVQEIDAMPLRDVVDLLGGSPSPKNGPPPMQSPTRKEITESEMAKLPGWARVAFAARCARRVQRLLAEVSPTAPSGELSVIERLIAQTEQSATAGRRLEDTNQAETLASGWENSQVAATKTLATGPHPETLSNLLRSAVGKAAVSAARSAVDVNAHGAYEAYGYATQAAFAVSSQTILELMRRDFVHLETMAKKESWTDQTAVAPTAFPQPQLRLVGLHIRGLRAIRQLDLPQDGLGWQGQVPDLILLAGVNGSGKTTLLNFLTDALAFIARPIGEDYDAVLPKWLDAQEAWADFELESYEFPRTRLRFVVGNNAFVEAHKTENCWWMTRPLDGGGYHGHKGNLYHLRPTIEKWFRQVTIPSVVLMPDDRTLTVPGESYKAAGKFADDQQFVHRWRRPGAWKESLEALLYSLRWEDLNAQEEAPFTQFSRFSAYADAFHRFSGDSKYLKFEEGELVVKIAGSTVAHDLSELSSGEKEVLLLTGELLRYWRPGSLVLIDEPELHLHSRWQTRLYEALRYWQKERGGQVILATQSNHLVEIADVGGMALLGVESP
jgi:predicted ATPase